MRGSSISRRALIGGASAAAGSLILASRFARAAAPGSATAEEFVTAWVRIAPDSAVTIMASQSEIGQGTTTTLAAAVADELYLPIEDVKIEFASFAAAYQDPVYKWMFTGNSQSISSFYDLMRQMGAAAREMLVAAAASRMNVAAGELAVRDGRIATSGRSISFGEVAGDAARLPVPAKPSLRADAPSAGRPVARWDIPAKVDGSAVFGIDVKLPGMVTATVRCAPRFGSKLTHYDAAKIKTQPGVIAVVEVPNGLAVAAKTYWQAHTAFAAGQLEWSDDGSSLTSGDALPAVYRDKLASGPFFSHKASGDAAKALGDAAQKLEAVYEIPFQAHATMEPMNCTAQIADGRCDIWAPTQGVELAQGVAAQITGLPSDKIVVHRTMIGGGFGRRLLGDFVKQTLIIAKAVERPVKLIWSREQDMAHDFYRPAMLHQVTGAVDGSGRAGALAHRVVSPSHMLYIFPRGFFPGVKDWTDAVAPPEKIDEMAVEGLVDIPYDIPHQTVDQHRLELDVPVSVWRTTGHGPNDFVLESFIDEMAAAAKADPLAFPRALLGNNARARNVLDLAADKSGWATPAAAGRGRGIALASAFGGVIAVVAELSVTDRKVKIHRIVAAVDSGRTLDPRIAESNILGGLVWGLSGMRTHIDFAKGAAMQANFDEFDPIHLWETPPCEVHFIDSGAKLGGTGELGPVPVHAAVGNAIFAATGERLRALPLSRAGFAFA